jgi:hypothetical protein
MAGRILPASWPQPPSPPAPPAPKPRQFRAIPTWRTGDKVLWHGYTGTFLRETVDGRAEVLIGPRTYCVDRGELRSPQDGLLGRRRKPIRG